ncbi:neo-calmodulin-like isoform X3 [Liolophura sinensis]
MNGYREQFKIFDINGDGMITRKEFRRIMGALGQPVKDAEVAAVWSEVDKNDDGIIDFNEFVDLMEFFKPRLNGGNQLRDIFTLFDKKGTGLVETKELVVAMTSLGEDVTTKEVKEIFEEVDKDRDGKINYEEFERVFREAVKSL